MKKMHFYAERVWKSDGSVNVMPFPTAVDNLRIHAVDARFRGKNADPAVLSAALSAGEWVETPLAYFRAYGESQGPGARV